MKFGKSADSHIPLAMEMATNKQRRGLQPHPPVSVCWHPRRRPYSARWARALQWIGTAVDTAHGLEI